MKLEEIQGSWKSEVNRPVPPTELLQILAAVQQRYDRLERSIHRRDIREILAALFVVAAFAAMWPLYRTSFVACLGVVIIMLGAAVIVYVLLTSRRPFPFPFNASVLDFSRQRLAWLNGQIHLLQTVAWWYVGPLFVGCLLLNWGLAGGSGIIFGLNALLDVAVAAGIIFLNRQAVHHGLEPIRAEVARLVEALETTNTK
jgi:hypothetical protein